MADQNTPLADKLTEARACVMRIEAQVPKLRAALKAFGVHAEGEDLLRSVLAGEDVNAVEFWSGRLAGLLVEIERITKAGSEGGAA